MKPCSLVYFDMETAGLADANPDIQLAAVAVDDDFNELATFERKIKFDMALADPEAFKINHFDAAVWEREAVTKAQCIAEFAAFLKANATLELISKRTGSPYKVARLAGHNVATFDMPRLRRLFGSVFMPAHPQPLDSLQLALWYFHGAAERPENNKLETLCRYFGVSLPGAHEALTDVRMSAALARCLLTSQAKRIIAEQRMGEAS